MKQMVNAAIAVLLAACSSGGSGSSDTGDVAVGLGTGRRDLEEGSGTQLIRIDLAEPPLGEVAFDVLLSGEAVLGVDYTTAGSIVLASGVSQGALELTVVQDDLFESSESIVLELEQRTGAPLSLGSDAVLEMAILDDDDPPTVSFEQDSSECPEGRFGHPVRVLLDRASGLEARVSVEIDTSSTALESLDFALAESELVIPAGELSGAFQLDALADDLAETNESAKLRLTSATGAQAGTASLHEVFLRDSAPSAASLLYSADLGGPSSPLFDFDVVTSTTTDVFDFEGTGNEVGRFVLSPDNSLLAMELDADRGTGLWISNGDGSELRRVDDSLASLDGDSICWSTDGSHVAYSGLDFTLGTGFYDSVKTHNVKTGATVEVYRGGLESRLAWSPVAHRLAMSVDDGEGDGVPVERGLYAVDANGQNGMLYKGERDFELVQDDFEWSSNGAWIAYRVVTSVIVGADLYIADDTTGVQTNVTSPTHKQVPDFAWQPGTSKLVFRGSGGGPSNLNLVDAVELEITEPSPDSINVVPYAWSPSGATLAFLALQDNESGQDLVVLDISSGELSVASGTLAQQKSFQWSPNEEAIALWSSLDGLSVFDLATESLINVVISSEVGPTYSWSPNGGLLAYRLEDAKELHVVTANGAEDIRIAADFPERPVRWSRDSTSLAWESFAGTFENQLYVGASLVPNSGRVVSIPNLGTLGIRHFTWR